MFEKKERNKLKKLEFVKKNWILCIVKYEELRIDISEIGCDEFNIVINIQQYGELHNGYWNLIKMNIVIISNNCDLES